MTRRAAKRKSASTTTAAADKLAATHARLLAAVDALVDAPAWRNLLTVAARMHSYSPNNLLLIASQRPDATYVHGYHGWIELGRHVREGERGIAILAPMLSRRRATTDTDTPAATQPAREPDTDRDDTEARALRGFRVVHVFDISQTDGPDIDTPTPQTLDGPAPLGLFSDLVDAIEHAGYTFGYADLAPANGRTDFTDRSVVIRPDMSGAQTVKTLAHELAHVQLHDPAAVPAGLTRRTAEVEAESVAYIVTAAHGIDADGYTVPYVTGWAGGDRDLVAATATRVLDCARRILTVADPADTPRPQAQVGLDRTLPAADRSVAAAVEEPADTLVDLTAYRAAAGLGR